MLAFSQQPAYNTQMHLLSKQILHPETHDPVLITVIVIDTTARVIIVRGGITYSYRLVPVDLPTLEDLQRLFQCETVGVYLAVIDMLKEMAK